MAGSGSAGGSGEPTIYPEFSYLLERISRRGGTTWLHTNGTVFPKPLAYGLSARRIHIVCSVDAGVPETYVKMKRRDLLERVWENLRRYIGAGCDVHLKYIVTDDNSSSGELRAFCERARRIGARRLIVDIDYNHPQASPAVLEGLIQLFELGQRHGMYTTFGATGAFFAPEVDVARRVREAARAGGPLRVGVRRLRHVWLVAAQMVRHARRQLPIGW